MKTINALPAATPCPQHRGTQHPDAQHPVAQHTPWHVRGARRLLRVVVRGLFRVRVDGLQHLPAQPVIVAANHLNWIDPFLLLLFLPTTPRLYVLGNRAETFKRPWRKRVIDRFGLFIALDQARPREAVRLMSGVLAGGGSLVIFPEGNVSPREAALLPLQPGAARLSLQHEVAIVPCGITGSSRLWPRRTLHLRIGRPLDPGAARGATPREQAQALTAVLEQALLALLPGDAEGEAAGPRRFEQRLTHLF